MPKPKITPGMNYATLTDFGDPTAPVWSDTLMRFDDACTVFAEHMDEGRDTTVFRVDAAIGYAAAVMIDVTDDAEARVTKWIMRRGGDLPEWLGGEPETCPDCYHQHCRCDEAYDLRAEADEIA